MNKAGYLILPAIMKKTDINENKGSVDSAGFMNNSC